MWGLTHSPSKATPGARTTLRGQHRALGLWGPCTSPQGWGLLYPMAEQQHDVTSVCSAWLLPHVQP